RLGVQVAGVVRVGPVEAGLLVADVLHRGPDLLLEALHHIARSADLAGDDDAVGGDHGLAGDPGEGVGAEVGVHHHVGDAVGDLVGVAFGDAFAGEDVGR